MHLPGPCTLKSFSRPGENTPLLCSDYVSFEYAIFARMYGLMLLLVFLYLRSRTLHPNNIVRNGLWLGALANADTFGVAAELCSGA